MKPVQIRATPATFDELAQCEWGAHEDKGDNHRGAGCATCIIENSRTKTVLTLRTTEQINSIYYAVCSGTFGLTDPDDPTRGHFRIACRIADELRPYASPELVKSWPAPSGY